MKEFFKIKANNINKQDRRKFPYFVNKITANDLIEIYNKYEGKCVFTGKKLSLDKNSKNCDRISFDRIDNTLPHYKWNLQLCSLEMNLKRGNLNNNIFKNLIK